ncbi:hypothetical protein B0A48_12508 [Cryoendolithus antarcticus]|uniref:tRNA(His) guanylyltransferase n=1 Tax=Cryoendolithus antarcticus TaxID=1507870 RepID=A0A1V8SS73_9PEZI|nr:hypothetical protein B0A48_12508 [Cryoendolithus antarcticus]
MANSSFQYVRDFETSDPLAPSNWIVIRLDGRGFSKLTTKYSFTKPNDLRGLALLNAAALQVVKAFADVVIAYGQSDEYSFVLHESTTLFDRRAAKLATTFAATFTAEYCLLWSEHFPDQPLTRPWPSFDGRCVAYPKRNILRDYLSWRQADCHVNNLYNTTFWNLVQQGGMSQTDAEESLKGTLSGQKNEILYSKFSINYNNEPAICRKGTVMYRAYKTAPTNGAQLAQLDTRGSLSKTQLEKAKKRSAKAEIKVENVDLIGVPFWDARPYILAPSRGDSGDE